MWVEIDEEIINLLHVYKISASEEIEDSGLNYYNCIILTYENGQEYIELQDHLNCYEVFEEIKSRLGATKDNGVHLN